MMEIAVAPPSSIYVVKASTLACVVIHLTLVPFLSAKKEKKRANGFKHRWTLGSELDIVIYFINFSFENFISTCNKSGYNHTHQRRYN